MSVDNVRSLKTYKAISKRNDGLESLFVNLTFNKKVPKYNYHSGLIAGMLVNNLVILQPILKANQKIDGDLAKKILQQIIPLAQSLAKDYNWKMNDLNNLAQQFFGDD